VNEYFFGFGLMLAGVVLFFIGRARSKRATVQASGGSVAVGGNNTGSITNTNINQPSKKDSFAEHGITLLAIFVEVAGIAVTVWHALHLATK